MTSRERIIKALNFEETDRLPRDLWFLESCRINYGEEVDRVAEEYPSDIGYPRYDPPRMPYQVGTTGLDLKYVDEWGCGWEAKEPGIIGEVVNRPIKDWSDLQSYRPPFQLVGKGMDRVNESCAQSDKFMLTGCCPRPFERMQFLRGSEQLYLDLAYGDKEVRQLCDMVHDYYMKEARAWMKTDVDGLMMMDDWGSQNALLISPDMWKQIFKPLYRDYCDLAHSHGKQVFMHSDGMIEAIYPHLIEIGVNALNSQLFSMDIEKLGRKYGGKITFWGEMDRQNLLPLGTREDIESAVKRLLKAFSHFDGGFIAQCEWGGDVSSENIRAVFGAFNQYGDVTTGRTR